MQDYVLIEPITEETTTSGIVISDKEKEKPNKGIVINIWSIPAGVFPGDLVYFNKYGATEIEVQEDWKDKQYIVVKGSDIFLRKDLETK